jgi:homoserine O-acetyltransferase
MSAQGTSPGFDLPAAGSDPISPGFVGDFVLPGDLELECGRTLAKPTLHYAVYGQPNAARDNVALACHALSGSALVGEWWPGLFSHPNQEQNAVKTGLVDLSKDCVICVNLLGSCYGSTGPGSMDPATGRIYGPNFPLISVRDNVRAQAQLLDSLGIARLRLVLGASIGGMQALEWAILYPSCVQHALVLAVAPLNANGLGHNHLQRQAILLDPDWQGGNYSADRPPFRGLSMARQIATITYKSPRLFANRFGRAPNRNGEDPWSLDNDGTGLRSGRFDIAGYLDHQGEVFHKRFDANSYLAILRTMELWDPARGYEAPQAAFAMIRAAVTFVGIQTDVLFPAKEVRQLAETVAAAGVRVRYLEMTSDHGHDAFLAEGNKLFELLVE